MKQRWMLAKLVLASSALLAPALSAEPTRVFVSDSQSWEISGGFGGGSSEGTGAIAGSTAGGARPQTAEIIKTFRERCKDVVVTMNREKANFVVLLEHEGGKGWIWRDNKIVVFNRDGDAVYSGSTRSLGNAVKDACAAILAFHSQSK